MNIQPMQKIGRFNTSGKESDGLPPLSPVKRMTSLTNQLEYKGKESNYQHKRYKYPSFQLQKKDAKSLKKLIDDKYNLNPIREKGSIKYTRKKILKNAYIMVEPLRKESTVPLKASSPIQAVSFDSYQGIRDYNQDRISVKVDINLADSLWSFFAVYDGHGGASVAQYLKNTLGNRFEDAMKQKPSRNVVELMKKLLKDAEIELLNNLEKKVSGGSCVTILIINNEEYFVANIGDSRVIKVSLSKNRQPVVEQLTTDHKPENLQESERIQKEGGKIYRSLNKVNEEFGPYRVLPGRLSVSRTIGDASIKKQNYGWVISSDPQTIKGTLSSNQLLILMSDGAYQKFTNQQIASYFLKHLQIKNTTGQNLQRTIHSFILDSMLRESSDNISIISVLLKRSLM